MARSGSGRRRLGCRVLARGTYPSSGSAPPRRVSRGNRRRRPASSPSRSGAAAGWAAARKRAEACSSPGSPRTGWGRGPREGRFPSRFGAWILGQSDPPREAGCADSNQNK